MLDWFKLLRVHQWYKNLIVFLIIFFTNLILVPSAWLNLLAAFGILCLISSANYIINDINDKEKDKLDKIKSKRPIPASKISIFNAGIIALFLLVVSLLLAFYLDFLFFILLLVFFVLTQVYTFWLKEKIFIDVVMIAINFMLRAVAGALVLGVYISSWFVIGVFFLAMFMVFAKRYGESVEGLHKNRKTLKFYSPELMRMFLIVFVVALILFYSLYIILMKNTYWFVATVPIFTYLLLRIFVLYYYNSDLARHSEKLFLRRDIIIGILVWLLLFVFAENKAAIVSLIF
jgi:4-hydroxybenzoate polyprenyltransferase